MEKTLKREWPSLFVGLTRPSLTTKWCLSSLPGGTKLSPRCSSSFFQRMKADMLTLNFILVPFRRSPLKYAFSPRAARQR
ncbi:hypothetical protein JG687_00010075 [Phytophthora cactorum]|uniref:Uncharacterized protein n=1 Tax=Phytophthora cactorum TaxID=29920 RepID=A0A8T1U9G9_9STRA|nr:hypothetical protein JG687_00010075 [Phytophthora cactorum]